MSVSLEDDRLRKDMQVLLELINRRIHRALELDQLITLEAELLRMKLEKALPLARDIEGSERLESIVSRSAENAQLLGEIRKKLEEELVGFRSFS